jgi:hypothetical protein
VKNPPLQITEPAIFILESLTLEDESNGRLDGKLLADVLRLYGMKSIYYYFRTRTELNELAKQFRQSGYRYLHLSIHGKDSSLLPTFGGSISYSDFADIFEGKLSNRRLFVSACELGNQSFAEKVFSTNNNIYSVLAPRRPIFFHQSTAFWSAFYFLMVDYDSKAMKREQIIAAVKSLNKLFGVDMAYFYHKTQTKTLKEIIFEGGKTIEK